MKLRSFLRLATRAALLALATASVSVGCSRQGEGERCDALAAGSDDCDSGLVCIPCGNLEDRVTDRCCPPGGTASGACKTRTTEAACLTQLGTGGTGGSGASAGSAGSAGSGAGSSGAGGTAGSSGAGSGGTAGEEDPAGAGGA